MTTITLEKQNTKEMAPQSKQELAGAESTRPGPVFVPPMDIFETEDAITLVADMPGVSPDGLTVDLCENVLSIEGRVADVQGADEQMLMQEYQTGAFRREFQLTNLIDQDRIDASLNQGVLRLTLPKAEAARPRRIEVRTS